MLRKVETALFGISQTHLYTAHAHSDDKDHHNMFTLHTDGILGAIGKLKNLAGKFSVFCRY